jgi:hypothetical protein
MWLGRLLAEYEWRQAFKPSILTGRKQRRTLAAHRGAAHAKQRQAVQERRAAIETLLREAGGALVEALRKRLRGQFGIEASPRTIRRDISSIRRR